jgi:hypothetical protein
MVVRWAFASMAGDLRTSNSGMDPSIEFAIISALRSIRLIEVVSRRAPAMAPLLSLGAPPPYILVRER